MKLKHCLASLFAFAVIAMICADASAQDEGGRRGGFGGDGQRGGPGGGGQRGGPGGGGRRGGPGGGGQRGGPGGGGDPMFSLLMNETVREEIELMPDQAEALKKIRDDNGGRGDRPDFDFRSASEEERREFMEKMRSQREETMKELKGKLEEVLLPNQFDRLREISIQVAGVAALGSPEVQQELGISEEQIASLSETREKIQGEMRDKMREMMQSGNRDGMREAFEGVRKEIEEKVLAVLTAEQSEKFEEMKGEPFELPEGFGRGGFGGRGGRDRGPGGGPGGDRGRGGRDRGPGGERSRGGDRPEGSRPESED